MVGKRCRSKSLEFFAPVALTASAMPDEVARAKQAGFLRHLPKPIVFADLEAAIKEVTST